MLHNHQESTMEGLYVLADDSLKMISTKSEEPINAYGDEPLRVSSLYLKDPNTNSSERLLLPQQNSGSNLDEYLSTIPKVVSRSKSLVRSSEEEEQASDCSSGSSLNQPWIHKASSGRCLNVLQGEVAHVSTDSADIVVSSEATTCHVVALRSTSSEDEGAEKTTPLVSVAHVDHVYEQCLENMIQEHLKHHDKLVKKIQQEENLGDEDFGFFAMDEEEGAIPDSLPPVEPLETLVPSFLPQANLGSRSASMPNLHNPIEMELHMIGGFLDHDGISQQLSTQLLEAFDQIAHKYSDRLRISLSTAAISCMNTVAEPFNPQAGDTGRSAPASRGLGIDTRTGEVFAVRAPLPKELEGPAMELRSARTTFSEERNLHVIHDTSCQPNEVKVQPFRYQSREDLNVLLKVPDEVLLKVTSTSPEHESDNFCANFRRTLSFVNTVPPDTVFEDQKPLVYTRSLNELNCWESAVSC